LTKEIQESPHHEHCTAPHNRIYQQCCRLKKGRQEIAIFQLRHCKFLTKQKFVVLKISILALNFPQIEFFIPNYAFFDKHFGTKKIFPTVSDSHSATGLCQFTLTVSE